jgi:hypothetical protein
MGRKLALIAIPSVPWVFVRFFSSADALRWFSLGWALWLTLVLVSIVDPRYEFTRNAFDAIRLLLPGAKEEPESLKQQLEHFRQEHGTST